MKITITFKHLEHTPALDEKIEKKSKKLEKFFDGNFNVDWVCWCDDKAQHWAELKVHGHAFDFHAKADADSLYKALDLVIEKVEKQMLKQKSKLRNKLHKNQALKFQEAG
jgi:putative sigma-54 modulation protein